MFKQQNWRRCRVITTNNKQTATTTTKKKQEKKYTIITTTKLFQNEKNIYISKKRSQEQHQ